MPRRKKKFPCGHTGYGQTCHRCAQEGLQQQQDKQQEKQKKELWRASFSADPIDLRPLPKNVVLKARAIIDALRDRQDYREFRGKRLRHDRHVVSIPVTRDYRLLCRDTGASLIPEAVVSHQDYNVCKPGG